MDQDDEARLAAWRKHPRLGYSSRNDDYDAWEAEMGLRGFVEARRQEQAPHLRVPERLEWFYSGPLDEVLENPEGRAYWKQLWEGPYTNNRYRYR